MTAIAFLHLTIIPQIEWILPCIAVFLLSLKYRKLFVCHGAIFAISLGLLYSTATQEKLKVLFNNGNTTTIQAKVIQNFSMKSKGYEGIVSIHAIEGQELPWYLKTNIKLATKSPHLRGDIFTGMVALKPIIGQLNEAGFDKETYWFSRSVLAFAKPINDHYFTETPGSIYLSMYRYIENIMMQSTGYIEAWSGAEISQDSLLQFTPNPILPDAQSLLFALSFGERMHIDTALWESLKVTGLAHLMAISGLHIGIAFLVGFQLGKIALMLNYRLSLFPWLFGGGVALIYTWLSGFDIPAQRALIMLLCVTFFTLLSRKVGVLNKTLLSMCFILVLMPYSALSMSFSLTFLALLSVFYFTHKDVTKNRNLFINMIFFQLGLGLFMLVITALYFQGISIMSVVFNLILVPYISFIVVPLILVTLMLTIGVMGVGINTLNTLNTLYVSDVWRGLVLLLEPIVTLFNAIEPINDLFWYAIPHYLFYILFCGLVLYVVAPFLQRRVVTFLVLFVGVLGLYFMPYHSSHRKSDEWRVDVLDVGHGLAILIEKNHNVILYDTGSAWDSGSYAQAVISPILHKRGMKSIEGVVISHTDADHAGGIQSIMQQWLPKWVLSSQDSLMSPAVSSGVIVNQNTAEEKECRAGHSFMWQELTFEVLWPPKSVKRAKNPHSCVVRIHDEKGHSILLTGDINAVVEWHLIRSQTSQYGQKDNLLSDVLIVPHHGSLTSSIPPFIQSVNAEVVIASTAYKNRWKLPHPIIKERYRKQGSLWLDTGTSGQVTLKINPNNDTYSKNNWQISSLREHKNHAWYRQVLRKGVEYND
ncbi:DNA internalization-related competence protein ComEC/Rec2 [Vibrio sp.]|nr:DNA internalization-related competence protein ComEC/Rec2 [Vibrio sp.]